MLLKELILKNSFVLVKKKKRKKEKKTLIMNQTFLQKWINHYATRMRDPVSL